ncbi:hypothetical protein PoB_002466000 [Plakobranchus ocellatus]|uniref:Uncharacterized protein n=1 Tax=Plakobranchus ocellatus TaxID=259542 RepID=A0AAV3ZU38_9GAST|nr:hypothetical protein PoB_002466000 [Plakobranchus ocellatus]
MLFQSVNAKQRSSFPQTVSASVTKQDDFRLFDHPSGHGASEEGRFDPTTESSLQISGPVRAIHLRPVSRPLSE